MSRNIKTLLGGGEQLCTLQVNFPQRAMIILLMHSDLDTHFSSLCPRAQVCLSEILWNFILDRHSLLALFGVISSNCWAAVLQLKMQTKRTPLPKTC